MKNVVIIDAVRTAIGRLGGTLKNEPVDFLASKVIEELITRTGIEPSIVDEVILGQAKQSPDQSNLARVAALRANLPVYVPAYTIQRQCGSGLQSLNSAMLQIQTGVSDVIIAGGAESMSTAPHYINNVRSGVKAGDLLLKDPNTASQPGSQPVDHYGELNMGVTAENVAETFEITRKEQDEFALRSQEKAKEAILNKTFEKEIVPYEVKSRKGSTFFKVDEHPRDTNLEKLSNLKTVFKKDGTVTAGNASGRNDGAAAMLVMSEEKAKELGLKPKVRVVAQAVSGCSPELMGLGPIYATKKALKTAELTVDDLDVIELNEAFSSQALACIRGLNLDIEKVNPNGGAIALGHPIGATGAILTTKIIHELQRTQKKYGLITLCIAGGMGIATIVENLEA